jgi:hypothetical protein
MSVADGIKFIMSLGSVSPDYLSRAAVSAAEAVGTLKGSGLRRNGDTDWSLVSPSPVSRVAVHSGLSPKRYEFIQSDDGSDPEANG